MRLFIATSFPESVLRELDERVRRVKTKVPLASWVRLETQHLTFAFLGFKETGIQLDGAAFKPHLTLCRIRDSWPPGCVGIFNAAFGQLESEPFPVDRITLYSSRLNPSGAVHTPVRQFSLA